MFASSMKRAHVNTDKLRVVKGATGELACPGALSRGAAAGGSAQQPFDLHLRLCLSIARHGPCDCIGMFYALQLTRHRVSCSACRPLRHSVL